MGLGCRWYQTLNGGLSKAPCELQAHLGICQWDLAPGSDTGNTCYGLNSAPLPDLQIYM